MDQLALLYGLGKAFHVKRRRGPSQVSLWYYYLPFTPRVSLLPPPQSAVQVSMAETNRLNDKKDHVTTFVAELYSDNFYT